RDEGIRENVMSMLRDHFRPEFLNRLDEIVMFHALGKKELAKIVEIQLGFVADRLKAKRITVSFTDAAKKLLAEKGYDPAYGARPLKRTIQDLILDDLSLQIIKGEIQEGDQVVIDAKNGKIQLIKQ
ncbi:hypothetical protein KKF59_02515, partial [Patescibacteria group bacterium]|nr:hypothetical protein [Patescibacteria group bacterium]